MNCASVVILKKAKLIAIGTRKPCAVPTSIDLNSAPSVCGLPITLVHHNDVDVFIYCFRIGTLMGPADDDLPVVAEYFSFSFFKLVSSSEIVLSKASKLLSD
ncbi:hypothetical protein Nepgr_013325 [Nepenthes gracilis]|uniref:Uncharacterized protein n=1 Tax=Nepenthes gracilis TaxID=150966 RepID=A0AAD3SIM8_NEPGR|nr:hypothetical protein Nepgr_013325 [Nepenthes gracilis]